MYVLYRSCVYIDTVHPYLLVSFPSFQLTLFQKYVKKNYKYTKYGQTFWSVFPKQRCVVSVMVNTVIHIISHLVPAKMMKSKCKLCTISLKDLAICEFCFLHGVLETAPHGAETTLCELTYTQIPSLTRWLMVGFSWSWE